MRVRCMLLPPTLPLLYIELHIIDGFKKKNKSVVYAQSTATSFLNEALPFLICLLAASRCHQAFATAWLC